MTFLPELDIAAGRVLWALSKGGPRRAQELPLFALGVTGEEVEAILARLEARGEARRDEGNVWSAVG